MPLGSFRINSIAKRFTVAAAAEVIRKKKPIIAVGTAQISTSQSKFGNSSISVGADGTNGEYIYVPNNSNADIRAWGTNDGFTFELWVRHTSLTDIDDGGSSLMGIMEPTDYPYESSFGTTRSGTVVFNYVDTSGTYHYVTTSGITISANTWYHYAFVKNGSNLKIYVNGTSYASHTITTTPRSSIARPFVIGSQYRVGARAYVDEVRISNTARYTANFTAPTSPFVNDENTLLLIHGDGTNGLTYVEDDNGVREKLSLVGVGNIQVDTAINKIGGASALFDGTGDYIEVNDPNSLLNFGTSTDFTIECWVYPNDADAFHTICANTNATYTTNGLTLLGGSGTALRLNHRNSGNLVTDPGGLTNDVWTHIAVTRSGNVYTLWKNGVNVNSNTVSNVNCDFGLGERKMRIGYTRWDGDVSSWAGNIDEFRVSNIARYTANFTPSTTPYVNDANTLLLIHADGTDGSTYFEDDNGVPGGHASVALTVDGNTKYSSTVAKYGDTSIYFDGANDKLTLTGNYSQPGDFTAECWFYPTSLSGDRCLFAIGNESTDRQLVLTSGNDLKLDEYGAGGIDITTDNTITLNDWNHAALTRSGTTITLWLNGVSQGTTTSSATIGNTNNFYIGALSDNAIDFIGYMDDIRLSRGARYTTTFTPSTTRLVDDANTIFLIQGGGANDSQAIKDTGSRSKKGITANGDAQVDTAQSKFGGASAYFDGNDGLTVNHSDIIFGTGNFTVELWYRPTSRNGLYPPIISNFNDSYGANEWAIFDRHNNASTKFGVDIYNVFSGGQALTSTTSVSNGTWYHIAVVRSGTTFTLYINGTSEDTTTSSASVDGGTLKTIFLAQVNGNYCQGHIDEVRISNTARYTENFTPSTEPFQNDNNTLLLLHMDGTDGSTVFTDDNGVPPDYDYGA